MIGGGCLNFGVEGGHSSWITNEINSDIHIANILLFGKLFSQLKAPYRKG